MEQSRVDELKAYITHWHAHLDRYLGSLVNPRGKRVLVIGSGWGSEIYWALDRGAQFVVGIDPGDRSEIPLRAAIAENPHIRPEQDFEIHRMRLEDYTGGDRAFDLVISNNVIEHIFGLATTLMCTRRLMRPGGRMAIFADPLYYSSAGSHIAEAKPWQHLWDNQSALSKITAPSEYAHYRNELNGFALVDFLNVFREAGLICLSLSLVADRNLSRLHEFLEYLPPGVKPFDYCIEGINALLTYPELL